MGTLKIMGYAPVEYELATKKGILYAPKLGWYLDARTPVHEAFVSHAHADHFSYHHTIHCSRETAVLLRALGLKKSKIHPYKFDKRYEKNNISFTLLPAGHIFGSAQLLIENPAQTVLYAGDVRLSGSRTCPPAKTLPADLLIIEGTYSDPRYEHLSVKTAEEKAIEFVKTCKKREQFPVFVCMSRVGKAQDLILTLAEQGFKGSLQWSIFQVTEACRKAGLTLPSTLLWKVDQPFIGDYLLITAGLLRHKGHFFLQDSAGSSSLAFVSGWAIDRQGEFDEYITWSDHADFQELMRFVEKVNPSEIWTFADNNYFVKKLRVRGYNAHHFSEIKSENMKEFETLNETYLPVNISNKGKPVTGTKGKIKNKKQRSLDEWL
ncbi:MAG: MBL fold metallo-hydrolase [Candidatus Hermodarchaeota archaeon]